jgi:OmpA-OmpF porin, OOP family
MPRSSKLIGALTLAAVLAVGSMAQARPFAKANSVEASLKMGGYFFLNEDEGLNDTFSYLLSGSYNFSDLMGAELALDFSPREVNPTSILHLHLDFMVHPFVHDWFVPFVGVGPTFSVTFSDPDSVDVTDSDFGLNAIVGIKFYPWDHVGFRVDTRYVARFGTDTDELTGHDLLVGFGVFVSFGGDEDEADEVLLDTDGDGFLDDVDACPTVPGVESAKGCPDKDGDTVQDPDDSCPDTPGLVALKGCPDEDGDGIIDGEDRCPKKAGPVAQKGCPDIDEDTLVDIDDRCPNIPGDVAYDGCPPPPPAEIVEKFSGVMYGIRFDKDSATIQAVSFPMLDEAVNVLDTYSAVILMIEGHTSAEGERSHNMALSKSRAAAVKAYLVERGINAARVETEGYGPDRPVASNDSEKDRRKNRRIEFKILRQ